MLWKWSKMYDCRRIDCVYRKARTAVSRYVQIGVYLHRGVWDYVSLEGSIQCSSLWNFRTSLPHAHHPAVKFRAKTSSASYLEGSIGSNKVLRFGFRECRSGTPMMTLLLNSALSQSEPFFLPTRRISYGFLHVLSRAQIGSPEVVTFSQTHSSANSSPQESKSPLVPSIRSWIAGLLVTQTPTRTSSAKCEASGVNESRPATSRVSRDSL